MCVIFKVFLFMVGPSHVFYLTVYVYARLVAFALSLALDPMFGIHSSKTLDTAQPCHLLKPN